MTTSMPATLVARDFLILDTGDGGPMEATRMGVDVGAEALVLVGSKNSCGFPMIETEQPTEPFPTANRGVGPMCIPADREQQ